MFDILHRGHVTYLAQARAQGGSLVVALNTDLSAKRLGKGPDRPLNGEIDRAAAAVWLERYALMPKDRAEQRVRFFDQYRSYVINYNLGKDLVRRFVETRAGAGATGARRWEEFEKLLSSPRLPSTLQ